MEPVWLGLPPPGESQRGSGSKDAWRSGHSGSRAGVWGFGSATSLAKQRQIKGSTGKREGKAKKLFKVADAPDGADCRRSASGSRSSCTMR